MKTIWMTDDELLAASTLQPGADHPLLLPSIPRDDEQALAAAIERGFRSLRIRATENDPQRWSGVIDLVNALIGRRPRLTAVWVDADGRPSDLASITRYHDLGDDLGVAEIIQPTGLHSFGLSRSSELADSLTILVRGVQQDGPRTPADWPERVPAPTGLLLVGSAGSVVVSAGATRLLESDSDSRAYDSKELDRFLADALARTQPAPA